MGLHLSFETEVELKRSEILAGSIESALVDRFPRDYLARNRAFPLRLDPDGGRLELVVSEPDRVHLIEEMVQMVGGRGALVRRASREVISALLEEQLSVVPSGTTAASPAPDVMAGEMPSPPSDRGEHVEEATEPRPSRTPSVNEIVQRGRRREHVLLVEEDPTQRFAVGGIFQEAGHRVTAIEDPGALFDVLEHGAFDVILLKAEHVDDRPEMLDLARQRFPGAQITVVRSFADLLRGEPLPYQATTRFWFEFAELTERILAEATPFGCQQIERTRWYTTRVAQHLGLAQRTVDTLRACLVLEHLARVRSGLNREAAGEVDEEVALEALVRDLRCPYDVVPTMEAVSAATRGGTRSLPPIEAQVLLAAKSCVAAKADGVTLDEVIRLLREGAGEAYELRVVEALIGILKSEQLLGALDRSRRIVLADAGDSLALKLRLANDGYDVEVCQDGESAFAAILREPPDLVIAEVVLPKIDGFGLLTKLRSDRRTARIPLVFLSTREDSAAVARGLRLGAEDYLVKPMNPEVVAIKASRLAGGGETASTTITGNLEEVSLVDVLQLLSEGGKTGCIRLWAGVCSGEIFLRNGVLVHARCGEEEGEDAFLKMMQARDGRFSVKADQRAPCESINEPLEALILEGLEAVRIPEDA